MHCWIAPYGVAPLLLRENEVYHVSCAPCLELPRSHSHQDLANKLVMIHLQEIGLRQIHRSSRLQFPPFTRSAGESTNSHLHSAWPLPLRLRFRLLCVPAPLSFSRASFLSASSVAGEGRSRLAACLSCISARSFLPRWGSVVDAGDLSCISAPFFRPRCGSVAEA